jgi:hypothetical protein
MFVEFANGMSPARCCIGGPTHTFEFGVAPRPERMRTGGINPLSRYRFLIFRRPAGAHPWLAGLDIVGVNPLCRPSPKLRWLFGRMSIRRSGDPTEHDAANHDETKHRHNTTDLFYQFVDIHG